MKLRRTRVDEIKVIAMNIACEKSFEDALEYIYLESGGLNSSAICIFEELYNMDIKGVTSEMYKHLLDKPYIYWLEDFMFNQYEIAERIVESIPDIVEKTCKEFSYWLYKKYSKDEITKRILEFICENKNFSEAVNFFTLYLNDVLDVTELEGIWNGITKHYTKVFEDDHSIEDFLDDLEYSERNNKTGCRFMMEFAVENFQEIIPYLDDWYGREEMKKLLLEKFKEKNSKDY